MQTLSETAFLVNWARASDPKLSKDPWAHLWVTEKSKQFGEMFKKKVCGWEEMEVCLRNRYFADCLGAFGKKHAFFTFLNIAAGFTTYPYLIGKKNTCIETDYPHVIAYKKKKLAAFEKEGKIPKREIRFIAMNLNQKKSLQTIESLIQNNAAPFFVLLEGLLYYLKPETVKNIFELLNRALPAKSCVGTISWSNKIRETPVMKAVQDYFEKELGFPKQKYTWIDDEWFEQWSGLKILERTDYMELNRRYLGSSHNFKREEIVDESFHLLEKS